MKIPDEILKMIEWESFPLSTKKGGQTVGVIRYGYTLKCDPLGFEVSVNYYRSQLKNKELCLTLFELFLMDAKIL